MPSLIAQAAAPTIGVLFVQAFGTDAALSVGGGDDHQRQPQVDAADDGDQSPPGTVIAVGDAAADVGTDASAADQHNHADDQHDHASDACCCTLGPAAGKGINSFTWMAVLKPVLNLVPDCLYIKDSL